MSADTLSVRSMKTFADASDALATSLPGYEVRAPQQRLAQAIEGVFSNDLNFADYDGEDDDYPDWLRPGVSHLLGQAGCGTGKSLAYLIPAILSGRRVVVSVTTKALQDQIVATDIPFLSQHLGREFSWALLKGRSNYLCADRLGLLNEAEVDGDRDQVVSTLRALWAAVQNPKFSGLREDVGVDVPQPIWSLVCSDTEECTDCKPGTDYAMMARAAAATANLVIVNHALFFSDLLLSSMRIETMLGQYDAVVFDEAHSIEEVAGNVLGGKISLGTFSSLTTQVRTWASQYDEGEGDSLAEPINDLISAATLLFSRLQVGRLRTAQLNEHVDVFGDIYTSLSLLRNALKKTKYNGAAITSAIRVIRL